MKTLFFLTLLGLVNTSMADTTKVSSSNSKINIARIERAITVQNNDQGRISVVETDNGGSTDIASIVYPSELLLTYFKDGEMINLQASFELGPIVSLKSAKKVKNLVTIVAEVKDEQLRSSIKTINVDVSQLLKTADKPVITVEDFGTQDLSTEVTIK